MKKIIALLTVALLAIGMVVSLAACQTEPGNTPGGDVTLGGGSTDTTPGADDSTIVGGTTGGMGNASDEEGGDEDVVDVDPTPATEGLVFALNSDNKSYYVSRYDRNATETSVYIPYTYMGLPVTEIGNNAFKHSVVTEVTLPKSLVKIGATAFQDTALTAINIPAATTDIASTAFIGCSAFATVSVEAENTVYSVIDNCLIKDGTVVAGTSSSVIPTDPSVTKIGEFAFKGSGISSVVVPANVTVIERGAFAECASLIDITVNSEITEIPDNFVNGCARLSAFTFPATVKNVGSYAFRATGLSTVDVADAVERLEPYAFADCASLVSVELSASLNTVDSFVFSGCSALKELVIPDGTVSIGSWAFNECISLKTVKLPSTLEAMGSAVFFNCVSLEEIRLPFKTTTLGGYVFYGCSPSLVITSEQPSKRIDWADTHDIRYIENADQSGLVETVVYRFTIVFNQPLVPPTTDETPEVTE